MFFSYPPAPLLQATHFALILHWIPFLTFLAVKQREIGLSRAFLTSEETLHGMLYAHSVLSRKNPAPLL